MDEIRPGASAVFVALVTDARRAEVLARDENLDVVEEASRESFPASDASGWIEERA